MIYILKFIAAWLLPPGPLHPPGSTADLPVLPAQGWPRPLSGARADAAALHMLYYARSASFVPAAGARLSAAAVK